MFDTTKDDLKDLLKKVDEAKLQLPDFQRDYVWGDEDVRSLIASVAKGYPVGALLTLETGGSVAFQPRTLAGVEQQNGDPQELLLDGQQRMTSLYQATYSDQPVRTRTHRGTIVERYYYIDILKALDEQTDFEECIRGVPKNKIEKENFGRDVKLDLSTREAEFEHHMFPLNCIFDSRNWFYDWRDYWRAKGEDVSDVDRSFVNSIVESIERYKMPIIRLDRNNSREAICVVFEKVNVGGKKLDAFELVTAVYAADNFDLRKDWLGTRDNDFDGRQSRIIGSPNRRDVLTDLASTDFLQACTLLFTRKRRMEKAKEGLKGKDLPRVSCDRKSLLDLPLNAYREYSDPVEEGFREAGSFLNEQNIIWRRDVPYPPLIVGLAASFAILGRDARTAAAKSKLALWFWSVTLGELYGSTTDTRLARDVPEIVKWISEDGEKPRSLDEAIFQQSRLYSMRSRNSAAYKGIHALLMKQGCRDFITGRSADIMTFFDDKIDIHHIFPKAWCKKHDINVKIFDSIINKTPLSKLSNISIGGDAPSVYLKRIEEKQDLSSDELDAMIRTHLIEPEHLRNDDFDSFFQDRKNTLTQLISKTISNPVVEQQGANEEEVDPEETVDLQIEEELYKERYNGG